MHSQCVAMVILYSITQFQAPVKEDSPDPSQSQSINSLECPGVPPRVESGMETIQSKRLRSVDQNDARHAVLKSQRVTPSRGSSAGSVGSTDAPSSSVAKMMWNFASMKPKRTL